MMNKSKLPMPARARKKMTKEIKEAQGSLQKISPNDTTTKPLLSTSGEKTEKKALAKLGALKKAIHTKKTKAASKTSKRTTPGQVAVKTTPQSRRVEGKSWIKATNKKIQANKKVLQHNTGKKK